MARAGFSSATAAGFGAGFGLDLEIEGSVEAAFNASLEELALAAMSAADAVEDWGKSALRKDTEKDLGPRVARTWRSRVYPNRRGEASLTPSITWWSNAPHIIEAFARGAEIRSSEGFWLAIPTENAPQTGRSFGPTGRLQRGRRHAITEAERRFGRLRYVPVRGRRLALLVADKVRRRTGQRRNNAHTRYTGASPTAIRKGNYENGVVMFVLVPAANLPSLINPDQIAEAIGREGLTRFANAFQEISRRRFGGPGG